MAAISILQEMPVASGVITSDSLLYYHILRGGMWDVEPVLYWRVRQDGKWTWQKARAAQVQQGLYAVEPPRLKVTETESEGESDDS